MTFAEELAKVENSGIEKIGKYLENRAKEDLSVNNNLQKGNKSLKGCMSYIYEQAKKNAINNCACIDDDTVYGWAVHYYDEDIIKDTATNNDKVKDKIEHSKQAKKVKQIKPPKSKKKVEDQMLLF